MKKVFLVIDDMTDDRKLVRLLLRKYDCRILEAASTVEGYTLALKCKPHCILIDHMMPNENGYDAIRRFREEPALRQTPIIMLTSRRFDAGFRDYMRMVIDDFLLKPVEAETLLDAIQARVGVLSLAPTRG
ncbi:MAG: response regulator [Elusimicrobia bacterium]|nr:response regulator [Elusimicrobiota bacterium]